MGYMDLVREYARICNVDIQSMLNHIQNDRFAEIQFLDWLKNVGQQLVEADRIQRENLARVSSPAYRKTEAKVLRSERSIRREVR